MHSRNVLIRAEWILMGLLTVVCCQAESRLIDRIVAKVDYSIITESDLQEACGPSIQQIRENFPPDEWDNRIREIKTNILMHMINEYVCVRFARENEILVTPEEVDSTIQSIRERSGMVDEAQFKAQLALEGLTLDELRDNLRRQTIVRKVMRREVQSKVRVTEADIKEYWQDNADRYQQKTRIRVAVLMLDTENAGMLSARLARDKIFEIHENLEKGADFAEMVAAHSDGPAKDQGGDIGFLEEGKALPVIEKAAFNMEKGQFSAPLETSFGYVIVKVLERMDAGLRPLDQVRAEIEETLRSRKVREIEDQWFERERAGTYIQMFDY
ncbi:peptidyl-prolyl cis-trans isomerase [bacterium]|nr:peptidyl-prolyl cis-trans isomerase [candidate division CSSED10-310 bacterium]